VDKKIDYPTARIPEKPATSLAEFTPDGAWTRISQILSKELSENSFNTWFSPVRCLEISETSVILGVPDSYYGQWLKDHYQDLILSASREVLGTQKALVYQVAPLEPKTESPSVSKMPEKSAAPGGLVLLNSKYTFDSFVIGPGNRFAHAAACAVAESPAKQYNPLFIYGPVGLGKTHLMQAIAHETHRRKPGSKVLYISSEKFTNQLITSIQTKSTQQFRGKYRNVDLLLIDDIHFIAGKEATQEEFFHTFNTLYDAHKQIVVTSDRSPKEIPGLEERLVSRFGWGLVTDIQPPDFETRVAILKKKMEKETVVVPDDVCYFIASKIRSNIRELEGALIRVVAFCSLTGQTVDLKTAQEVLRDSLKEEEQNISMERIQRVVADFFNLKISDLRAKRRNRSVAFPRQIAMYLIRSLTAHSLPEIGEYFGGRDHTTVLHSVNKIDSEMEEKVDLRKTIQEIKELLKKNG
jgi:chromosomal replication initiator protein